jgi:hypothetical protein
MTYSEGNLEISFPDSARAVKFDDNSHELTHCMKAVDFIVEHEGIIYFVEFKDPSYNNYPDSEIFINDFLSGNLDSKLCYKYRDSFLYQWAAQIFDIEKKPVYYSVLIALDNLDRAELNRRTESLKKKLPLDNCGKWKRNIVSGCGVFNIDSWNKHFDFPVKRK